MKLTTQELIDCLRTIDPSGLGYVTVDGCFVTDVHNFGGNPGLDVDWSSKHGLPPHMRLLPADNLAAQPPHQQVPLALLRPPSHPTSLGDIWIGETNPSPENFALAMRARAGGAGGDGNDDRRR